jgi:hypothetical protein
MKRAFREFERDNENVSRRGEIGRRRIGLLSRTTSLSPMRSITWPTYFASSSGRWTRKTSVCRGRGVPAELAEPGILVVSELVTNGIQHAGTPTIVWAEYEAGTLTVAVTAGEALLPALLAPDDAREGGRGIAKIDHLATSWGLTRTGLGKVAWATLEQATGSATGQPEA